MTNIIDDATLPIEPPAKKTRARKSAQAAKLNPAASLIAALNFISMAQYKKGTPQQTHCIFNNHYLIATNGLLTIGTMVEEDLYSIPHTFTFLDALKKCTDELVIAQVSQTQLNVASQNLNIAVPFLPTDSVFVSGTDEPIASIDDRLKLAFKELYPVLMEDSPRAVLAGLLLQADTAVATNGHLMLEYWHGIDLPPNMLLPKQFAAAVAKTTKSLKSFGYSESSVTFWFEDGSFIKTQRFAESYINYQMVLDSSQLKYDPIPEGFFEAINVVSKFTENNQIFFINDYIASSEFIDSASKYKFAGLPNGYGFDAKLLMLAKNAATHWAFDTDATGNKVFLTSDKMRGVLAGLGKPKNQPPAPAREAFDDFADDVPY